jgi:3-isopropylmalate/(R)-2-methylmalate dehydratase small subunit
MTIVEKVLAAHVDRDVVRPGEFVAVRKVQPGEVLVGGENFGCGSSREHAPLAITGAGIACVVARLFARIFYRNAINLGLRILISPGAADAIPDGAIIRIDLNRGLITAGGLVPYVRDRLAAERGPTAR